MSKPLFLTPVTALVPLTSSTSVSGQEFDPLARRPFEPAQALSMEPTIVLPSMGPATVQSTVEALSPTTPSTLELSMATIKAVKPQEISPVALGGSSEPQGPNNGMPASTVVPGTDLQMSNVLPGIELSVPSVPPNTRRPASSVQEAVAKIAIAIGQGRSPGDGHTRVIPQTASGVASGVHALNSLASITMAQTIVVIIAASGSHTESLTVATPIITPGPQAPGQAKLVFTFNDVLVTALQVRNPNGVVIGDTALTSIGQEVSKAGHVFVAAANGIVVDGRTVPFSKATPTNAGSQTFTVIQHANSDFVIVDGQRIITNGDAVDMDGHTFNAIDDGIVVDGHTTLMFSAKHSALTAANQATPELPTKRRSSRFMIRSAQSSHRKTGRPYISKAQPSHWMTLLRHQQRSHLTYCL